MMESIVPRKVYIHQNPLSKIDQPIDSHPFRMLPTKKPDLLSYIYSNLADLTMEMVHNHIITTLFPIIVSTSKIDQDTQQFIQRLPQSIVVVWRWCQNLELIYTENKEVYYIDGH